MNSAGRAALLAASLIASAGSYEAVDAGGSQPALPNRVEGLRELMRRHLRHHHGLGETTLLNITPRLRSGGANEIEMLFPEGTCHVERIAPWAHEQSHPP
jgi:hypothetical protein